MSDDFFKEKRPWSTVKDGILAYYIKPYLQKVQRIRRRILLVDTFAGPGRFEDGERGSPLIICETAENVVPGRYDAVFTNKDTVLHEKLSQELSSYDHAFASPYPARDVLRRLNRRLINGKDKGETLFLYLDPYGIEDCDFKLVKPLLDRTVTKRASTELLIVLQMPYVHRQAAREQVLAKYNELDPTNRSYDQAIALLTSEFQEKVGNVDRLMGGTYWREIEYGDSSTNQREEKLIDAYLERLAKPGRFGMACPVEADYNGPTKYYMCFVSRSEDAAVIMNEAMYRSRDAYYGRRAREIADENEPLFRGIGMPSLWEIEKQKAVAELRQLIPKYVMLAPGEERQRIWFNILLDHFMRFSRIDYRALVNELALSGEIKAINKNGVETRRSNPETLLYPAE